MNRKFTPPMKFFQLRKKNKDIRELMDWYEEKMALLEKRQYSISEKFTRALDIVYTTIDEFHSTTCFWTHTENLKQTIKDRIAGIEVKISHKMSLIGKKKGE